MADITANIPDASIAKTRPGAGRSATPSRVEDGREQPWKALLADSALDQGQDAGSVRNGKDLVIITKGNKRVYCGSGCNPHLAA